mmetsp:Transcript_73517/g.227984  ORF Transcript_73517/g.227984 Transcript_73517/m.227984 type:complete len:507 (-) Transcript_73517:100-1620(-)
MGSRGRGLLCLVSTLLGSSHVDATVVSRFRSQPANTAVGVKSPLWTPRTGVHKFRQVLRNYHDLQYVTYLSIGQQTISGIIDTGSFELVVFSKRCPTCGKAGKFDPGVSASYRAGSLSNRQSYGSGDAYSREAFDFVSFAAAGSVNQTFWEVTHAQMPLLINAEFQAIIGVGPPETPAADAWSTAQSQIKTVQRYLHSGVIPPVATTNRVMSSTDVAVAMTHNTPMLSTIGVDFFSVCLGSKPGTDGFFVWNDTAVLEKPSLFMRVPVVAKHTWTLNLTGVWLSEPLGLASRGDALLDGFAGVPMEEAKQAQLALPTILGCDKGCGAVIDSGTSMLVMPTFAIDALSQAMQRMDTDCSNLRELPDLVFDFAGSQVSLPPDAYVAEVVGDVPEYLEGLVRPRKLGSANTRCELMVMESSSDTNYGPLWILGMPFFRSYYTTFQVGRSLAERAIFFSPAGYDCQPGDEDSSLRSERDAVRNNMRRLDTSKMLISQNAMRAAKSSFIHL